MDPRKLLGYGLPDPPNFCKNCDSSYSESCPKFCEGLIPQSPPPPPPPPPPAVGQFSSHKHFRLPIFLTVAIVILATAFFFFTCFTVYRFYACWRRSGRRQPAPPDDGVEEFLDEDRSPVVDHPIWYIRTVGLDAAVIEAITIVRYKRGEGLIDGTDCSVCLSEFQDDEALRLLPKCSHAFHLPCIDTWLRSHTNCPMCRAQIVADNTLAAAPTPAVQHPEEIQITLSEVETEDQPSGGELDGSDGLQQQPVRRSVSLDSMSALTIQNAVQRRLERDSEKQMIEEKGEIETAKDSNGGINELTGSPTSIQTGPSAVKRSLSCSAKVFLARHSSRSRNSQL